MDLLPYTSYLFFAVGFTDEIEITGGYGASLYDPTGVTAIAGSTPTWTFDGTNTITGTAEAATGSDDGTLVVSFDQVVDHISFQYRNLLTDGQIQWIGLLGISFRRAPEPSAGLLVAFGLLLMTAGRGGRSRQAPLCSRIRSRRRVTGGPGGVRPPGRSAWGRCGAPGERRVVGLTMYYNVIH